MLQDTLGRRFTYLRLSITDQCNFRCLYCLPNGYQKNPSQPPFLSVDEIRRLITGLSQLGFCKVRLTGGEPTLRRDFLTIAAVVSSVPHVKKVMLSTNGYRLLREGHQYQAAGIRGINVSIDSLDASKFKSLTGHDKLSEIIEGIEKAITLDISPIKINTVLMKGINEGEIPAFIAWVKDKPVCVRFIELMPTGINQGTFKDCHLPAESLKVYLNRTGWVIKQRSFDSGPAAEYVHSDFVGSVGIIAPYAKNFCSSCNRLRITSLGELKLCLFGEARYSLRHLLQRDDQTLELQDTLKQLLFRKKETHELHIGKFGDVAHFAAMGG